MAQINKGDTFVDGQSVTGSRLNALVDSATLAVGAITDQTNVTAGSLVSADSTIVAVSGVLKEATMGDINGSNIPVVTSSITAGANSDIVITPNDGTIVTGQAYTSADGLTVTVTSTAHTLTAGQVILVASAGTGYNGTFRVATVLTNSFTYVMTTAATAGSGTLSYTKKGLVKNPANKSIAGNLYVDGNTIITGTTIQTGAVTHSGAVTQSGAVTMNSTLSVAGNVLGALNIPTAPTSGNHATNKTYVDGTVSKTVNGYVTLPNGLIMQWGRTDTYGGSQTITLPISFPTACLWVSGTSGILTTGVDNNSTSAGKNGTSLSTILVTDDGYGCNWQAIGY